MKPLRRALQNCQSPMPITAPTQCGRSIVAVRLDRPGSCHHGHVHRVSRHLVDYLDGWKVVGLLRGRSLLELVVARKQFRKLGGVQDKKNPGMLRKTRREDSLIVRKSLANRFKIAPQMRAEVRRDYSMEIQPPPHRED